MSIDYNRNDILQSLTTTLQDMLIAAKNDDWEEVIRCNEKRNSLSSQLRATNQQTSEELRMISELSQLDTEIADLAVKARDAASHDMQSINSRKSNVNQYLQNQFS